jgi:hypothetical protein
MKESKVGGVRFGCRPLLVTYLWNMLVQGVSGITNTINVPPIPIILLSRFEIVSEMFKGFSLCA